MAVSKRLRFAIFERDEHTCRYCGRSSPEVVLEIDHVLAVAFGGTDTADNLVTACRDCNSGKSSSTAGAPKLPPASLDLIRWAKAIEGAASDQRRHRDAEREAISSFEAAWPWSNPPEDWQPTISRFVTLGLSASDLLHILAKSYDRTTGFDHCWRYFCKVAWSEVKLIRARAEEALRAEPEPFSPSDPAAGLAEYEFPDEVPMAYRPELPPFFEEMAQPRPLCVECDDRPAGSDGMCSRCRRAHYEGTA